VASNRAEAQVQSFLVSKTLEVHADTSTRQNYNDKILAPAGYRFQRIIGVKTASMSHSPSNGIEASIGTEGSFIQTVYNLESGPVGNPWRAWIDAFVTAKLEPINK
jgi:serine protease Do